jgi:hypothetical protein
MDMNIDLKFKLETPEGDDGPERTMIVTLNPFTVAVTKELGVQVTEAGKDGAVKLLGKTKLALGSLLKIAKQAKE